MDFRVLEGSLVKKADAQTELFEQYITRFVCRLSWRHTNVVVELLKNLDFWERLPGEATKKPLNGFKFPPDQEMRAKPHRVDCYASLIIFALLG